MSLPLTTSACTPWAANYPVPRLGGFSTDRIHTVELIRNFCDGRSPQLRNTVVYDLPRTEARASSIAISCECTMAVYAIGDRQTEPGASRHEAVAALTRRFPSRF